MAPGRPTPEQLRGLYRELLREAKRFPSMRKNAILKDIKLEWREKASLTDVRKINQEIEVALRG
jgi:hypothetical protein